MNIKKGHPIHREHTTLLRLFCFDENIHMICVILGGGRRRENGGGEKEGEWGWEEKEGEWGGGGGEGTVGHGEECTYPPPFPILPLTGLNPPPPSPSILR